MRSAKLFCSGNLFPAFSKPSAKQAKAAKQAKQAKRQAPSKPKRPLPALLPRKKRVALKLQRHPLSYGMEILSLEVFNGFVGCADDIETIGESVQLSSCHLATNHHAGSSVNIYQLAIYESDSAYAYSHVVH
jgi:hypothetical protein